MIDETSGEARGSTGEEGGPGQAARAVPQTLPELPPVPTSPKIRKWNQRITAWGCAPLMLVGMVAAFIPGAREPLTIAGSVGILLVGIPVVGYSVWLRRENARRFHAAWDEAIANGQKVRTVAEDDGDNTYALYTPEQIEPVDWDELLGEQ